MNKEFKVGQRVWVKEHYNIPKGFYTIRNFTNNGFYIENKNGIGGSVFISGIHQTADDMFEELGFEKNWEDGVYIVREKFDFETGIITELRIIKKLKAYKISSFTQNNKVLSSLCDMQLHLAIHQKLIELGWIE